MTKLLPLFIGLFMSLSLIGCGNNNVNVTGKIMLSDGTPVSSGNVIFISGASQGKGTISPDGTYSLSFQKKGDGIPPGTYQVLVTGAFFIPSKLKPTDEMDTGTRPIIDNIYAETETSPLNCMVPNESGYDFTVEPSKDYTQEKKIH
jgi:hypothetical protein